MLGRTLSHYKVLEEISRGGMGIVYKALDLKLNREVALKVLPPELVSDPDRKRRFIQEARASALNSLSRTLGTGQLHKKAHGFPHGLAFAPAESRYSLLVSDGACRVRS